MHVKQPVYMIPIKCNLGRLKDSRMQNMVLLVTIAGRKLIPGTEPRHYFDALDNLLAGSVLKENNRLFREYMSDESDTKDNKNSAPYTDAPTNHRTL